MQESDDKFTVTSSIRPKPRPSKKDHLRYPLDESQTSGWIEFTPVEYLSEDVADGFSLGQLDQDRMNSISKLTSAGQEFLQSNIGAFAAGSNRGNPHTDAHLTNVQAIDGNKIKLGDYDIRLYLPENIQISDNVNYSATELNILGAGLEKAIQNGQGVTNAVFDVMTEPFTSSIEALKTFFKGGSIETDAAKLALLRVSQRGKFGQTVPSAISAGTGIALNPNVRSLLSSVNLREFAFAFRFFPESPEEARIVKDIENTFRTELYPESLVVGGVPFGYKFPRQFLINMYYNNNPLDIQIQKVFLRNMQVVHNPGNMGWHEDGYASETQMTLSFVEDKALDKQSLNEGSRGKATR
jgi:hypothetical protein